MFTQKEMGLLEDLKNGEKLCTEKYRKYAQQASSPQLQSLFQTISGQEQRHLQTLEQMASGSSGSGSSQSSSQSSSQGSTMNGSSGSNNQSSSQSSSQSQNWAQSGNYQGQDQNYQNDSFLCSDALATEKHVSADYNTCIFEFKDPAVRSTLNSIQQQEQSHGMMLYDYMSANGMYN